jgi:phospholipase D1/2
LRSSDNWSTGIKSSESSILQAYLELIRRAKRFIYIENQFFISNPGQGGIVKNSIAKALKNRILDAHEQKESFLVIVFIPLMPGFEGDVLKGDSAVLKTQIKYQQETISKGKNSLCQLLEDEGITPSDYIRFYSLRQHALLNNVPKTEIIYIHSKLMIVDDRKVIIGSANINDRSMLGTRDSEIAVLIEDEEVVMSKMGGDPFKVGVMPHAFRTEIFKGKCFYINIA